MAASTQTETRAPGSPGSGQRRALLLAAALLTVILFVALLEVSLRAMPAPVLPPLPLEVQDGPWAGWWLDAEWSVDASGDLVGDTSAVHPYPLEAVYPRYAFPPLDAPQADYEATFDLTLTRGTLYLGVRAGWHPAGSETFSEQGNCESVVFPLHDPLLGMALHRRACRMAGVLDTAAGLARPYSAALRAGEPQQVSVVVRGGQAQFITAETVIYDVATGRAQGGLYLALGPQSQARVSPLTWTEPGE